MDGKSRCDLLVQASRKQNRRWKLLTARNSAFLERKKKFVELETASIGNTLELLADLHTHT